MITGFRDHNWKLGPALQVSLDIRSGDNGVESPNLRHRLKAEIPRQHGNERF